MRAVIGLFLMILGLTAPAAAQAAITVKLSGYVYFVTPSVQPYFTHGQAASAWFSYDPSSEGRAWYPAGTLDPAVFFYENAPIAGGMSVGSYEVTFTDSARMFVTNQEDSSFGPIDRVLFDDHNPIASDLGGRAIDVVSIGFQDNTAAALDSLALPTSRSTFAAFPSPRASIDWTPYIGAEHRISMVFDNVQVTGGIPEPSTWAMLILGFGASGAALRMSRRKQSALASA